MAWNGARWIRHALDGFRRAQELALFLPDTDGKREGDKSRRAVTLDRDGQGYRISRSTLTLRASVPNLSNEEFTRLAQDAEKNCPVSKLLNAEITLDAKLE
jgi:organic hydroperoxide reductase OsmC/OhrA